MNSTYILGISAFYHDSAACLLKDGEIFAAAQEERFTRIKHDFNFPKNAAEFCLQAADITVEDLSYVVFYDKPLLKFERLLETFLATAPLGYNSYRQAIPLWLKEKLWIPDTLRNELEFKGEVLFTEHHQSHAGSAFYPSPFQEAAVLTIDGVGEWATNSLGYGKDNKLTLSGEIKFPHSIGLLYSAFTYFTGFKVNSGEYKVMGLAPYGEPKYVNRIFEDLIDLKADGSYRLNLEYFNYLEGQTMTKDCFGDLFDGPKREPESPLTQREMDLARSIQEVTEEVMLRQARHIHKITGSHNLCMAGGVALNCVGNGKIVREGPFKNVWIQPAAGDAGGALGAAVCAWYGLLNKPRIASGQRDSQRCSLLGPAYSMEVSTRELDSCGAKYTICSDGELATTVAGLLAEGKVIGWFQGAMEFGPRALGNRSIIGDPRNAEMQSKMNLKIKFRESFRPFAPAVLREDAAKYFELEGESPYMLVVAPVREERRRQMTAEEQQLFGIEKLNVPRSDIPAITHVDYSARIQTVTEEHPRFYALLKAFKALTGCSVLVNTSFNVRGEPIVCTPTDAYRCFMRTDMDYLVVNNIILSKKEQPKWEESSNWKSEFTLD